MLKIKRILFLASILAFFSNVSCRASKTVSVGSSNLKLSARQLIKENTSVKPVFKTLQSRLKITYSEGEKRQSHTVSYRMEKDKILWISAPFSIIRAKITPDYVAFYNKLDNTYFEGDFKFFSKLVGTDLDFEKLQNIMLGEALFNLKTESYNISTQENNYVLAPKYQKPLFEIFYLLDASSFKVKSQQLTQMSKQRHLQIDYVAYQNIEDRILPNLVKVIAVDGKNEVITELEFKSVELNEDLRFPFKIPSGFKKIEL